MTNFEKGFKDLMQKVAVQRHGKYSPVGALTYGGLGALIGALIDRKKRRRGALVGGLLGALGGTAVDLESFSADRTAPTGDAKRSGARAAELGAMSRSTSSKVINNSVDTGRELARRNKQLLDEGDPPMSLEELARFFGKKEIEDAATNARHAREEQAAADELKARADVNRKGLGKRLNPDYAKEFDDAYAAKLRELAGWDDEFPDTSFPVADAPLALLGAVGNKSESSTHRSGRRASGAAIRQ